MPPEGGPGSRVLLVDAANVIGSRPTGWWRDRAGAARALVARLREATADGRLSAPVIVVLEGQARAGADETEGGGVRVVHASGSGDDCLAQLAMEAVVPVLLVSADRELRRRAEAAQAASVGPNWLYEQLSTSPRAR